MFFEKIRNTKRKFLSKDTDEFKIYLFVCLVYLIGIILGAIYFRLSINDVEFKESIIEQFTLIKESKQLSKIDLLTESIIKNLKTLLIFWIIGASAIGSPFLILLCGYKGFSVAFTIATILISKGLKEGIYYMFRNIFLYTSFSIIGIIVLTVSSLKVMINIFKNKKDIRLEIIRHSIITFISIIFFICSVLCETFLFIN